MQVDYADIVSQECRSSSAQSSSKTDSKLCLTGESRYSKTSVALTNAEVRF